RHHQVGGGRRLPAADQQQRQREQPHRAEAHQVEQRPARLGQRGPRPALAHGRRQPQQQRRPHAHGDGVDHRRVVARQALGEDDALRQAQRAQQQRQQRQRRDRELGRGGGEPGHPRQRQQRPEQGPRPEPLLALGARQQQRQQRRGGRDDGGGAGRDVHQRPVAEGEEQPEVERAEQQRQA